MEIGEPQETREITPLVEPIPFVPDNVPDTIPTEWPEPAKAPETPVEQPVGELCNDCGGLVHQGECVAIWKANWKR